MTTISLLPRQDARTGRDRLEVLTALINAPSFDPLFRAEIIKIPLGHPVYRWECLVTDCERSRSGHGDLCSAHAVLWRQRRDDGESRADLLRTAPPAGLGEETEERPCRICPQRPARQLALQLCHHHQFRWYHHRERHGVETDFDGWLAEQEPLPGYGNCRVQVCPELADSPLGLCYRHERRYHKQGSPGGAALPVQWSNRFERVGRAVPVSYADERAFQRWCARAAPVLRPGQVNLRGLHPLLRAEIQWGLFAHTQAAHGHWELAPVQGLANYCRERGLHSLTELA